MFKNVLKGLVIGVATCGIYYIFNDLKKLPEHISTFLKVNFPRYYYEELNKKIREEHTI